MIRPFLFLIIWSVTQTACYSFTTSTKAGFFLPDSLKEFTLRYRTIDNLIVLPVTINDSVKVNLILDTGCRNVVLFGKRLQRFFRVQPKQKVELAGMGTGKSSSGMLSIDNKLSIGLVKGNAIPLILAADRNLFSHHDNIDGLIGYEIFSRFEIEINPLHREITFRSGHQAILPSGYSKVEMKVVDSKPLIPASILINDYQFTSDLLIDTGSSVSLLLKSTDIRQFRLKQTNLVIGKGLNGYITGGKTTARKVLMGSYELSAVATGIIESSVHNYASMGMQVLKHYSVILNYAQSYAAFKRLS